MPAFKSGSGSKRFNRALSAAEINAITAAGADVAALLGGSALAQPVMAPRRVKVRVVTATDRRRMFLLMGSAMGVARAARV